jgi:hypothetical protein
MGCVGRKADVRSSRRGPIALSQGSPIPASVGRRAERHETTAGPCAPTVLKTCRIVPSNPRYFDLNHLQIGSQQPCLWSRDRNTAMIRITNHPAVLIIIGRAKPRFRARRNRPGPGRNTISPTFTGSPRIGPVGSLLSFDRRDKPGSWELSARDRCESVDRRFTSRSGGAQTGRSTELGALQNQLP